MKVMKKLLCLVMVAVMMIALIPGNVEAKSRVALNKKKVTLTITNKNKKPKTTLKVKGVSKKAAKKAKWYTSNKKVVTVKKGKVTAKKAGKAVITCKIRSKKYKCRVTVKDKRKTVGNGTLNVEIVQKASETGLGPWLPRKLSAEVMKEFKDGTLYTTVDKNGNIIWERRPLKLDENGEVPAVVGKEAVYESGDPYATNKIKVTYNGKDVTDKAKYKIDKTQIAKITSPGVIELSNVGMLFELTVSYNGAKKIVKMGKTPVKHQYMICYCGTILPCLELPWDPNNEDLCKESHRQPGDYTPCNCINCGHMTKNKCGGFWTIDFMRYIDLRIK